VRKRTRITIETDQVLTVQRRQVTRFWHPSDESLGDHGPAEEVVGPHVTQQEKLGAQQMQLQQARRGGLGRQIFQGLARVLRRAAKNLEL